MKKTTIKILMFSVISFAVSGGVLTGLFAQDYLAPLMEIAFYGLLITIASGVNSQNHVSSAIFGISFIVMALSFISAFSGIMALHTPGRYIDAGILIVLICLANTIINTYHDTEFDL